MRSQHPPEAFDLDYIFLRKAIGTIALLLPVLIVAISWWLDNTWDIQESISHYYYTHSRNYFVGSLCALAVFFLSYDHREVGEYKADNYWSNAASAMAVGVAFFPTTRNGSATGPEQVIGTFHLIFAGSLFATLGILSLFFFTKNDGSPTPEKLKRNTLYKVCGVIIFACIALIGLAEIVSPPSSWHSSFLLESIMVWAFAVSWLVKGGFLGLLADKPQAAESPDSKMMPTDAR